MQDDDFVIAAIGCGRLRSALRIAEQQPFVVFATIDRRIPAVGDRPLQIYFYETG